MRISGLQKILLTMLLALAAIAVLPACTSTEEVPQPEESSLGWGACGCVLGDIECKEKCLLDPPI